MAKIISQELAAEIEKRFTYHAPKEGQPEKYQSIRNQAYDLALNLIIQCPDSHELRLALEKLQEAIMWANASIAMKGK